jgi:hypothetical protein
MNDKFMAGVEGFPEENVADTPELPAHFMLWLTTAQADFLRTRFLWANWDVEELIARRQEIEANPLLFKITIGGWPFT